MYCNKCGTEIIEKGRFCPECGAVIEEPKQTALAETEEPQMQEAPQNIAMDVKESPVEEKKVKKTILSVLLCLLLFVSLVAFTTIHSFRDSIGSKSISNMVDDVELQQLITTDDVQRMLRMELDQSEAKEIVKESSLPEFVQKTAEEYAGYVLGGDKPDGISAEDVVELVEDNEDVIEDATGRDLEQIDYNDIEEYFENNGEIELGMLAEDSSMPDYVDLIRIICSIYVFIALLLIILLAIVVLFKVRRLKLDSFGWAGIPFVITGAVFVIAALLKSVLLDMISVSEATILSLIDVYASALATSILKIGGIVLAVGVVMIIVAIVARKIRVKKASVAK